MTVAPVTVPVTQRATTAVRFPSARGVEGERGGVSGVQIGGSGEERGVVWEEGGFYRRGRQQAGVCGVLAVTASEASTAGGLRCKHDLGSMQGAEESGSRQLWRGFGGWDGRWLAQRWSSSGRPPSVRSRLASSGRMMQRAAAGFLDVQGLQNSGESC
jgi:hypothetical protein